MVQPRSAEFSWRRRSESGLFVPYLVIAFTLALIEANAFFDGMV